MHPLQFITPEEQLLVVTNQALAESNRAILELLQQRFVQIDDHLRKLQRTVVTQTIVIGLLLIFLLLTRMVQT